MVRREKTMSEKITGVKEEIAGKITHNPEKIQHGIDTRTGELKRKKREEDEVGFAVICICAPLLTSAEIRKQTKLPL